MAGNLVTAPRIRLHLDVHAPVELVEMTLAFQGLGHEYQSFIREQAPLLDEPRNVRDIKLYITRIESNCILAELAPALQLLGALAPVFSDVNNVVEFVRNTSNLIDWLRKLPANGRLVPADIPYGRRKISNVRDIVRLVGQNTDSRLGLSAIRYEDRTKKDTTVLEMSFSDVQCREAERGAARALQALETREQADYESVLMYFYQTNTDDPRTSGRTGDKAVIASLSPDPLRVYVIPEMDRQKVRYVLDDKAHNPLLTGFVVDVNIEKDPAGHPRVYRVLRVHDVLHEDD